MTVVNTVNDWWFVSTPPKTRRATEQPETVSNSASCRTRGNVEYLLTRMKTFLVPFSSRMICSEKDFLVPFFFAKNSFRFLSTRTVARSISTSNSPATNDAVLRRPDLGTLVSHHLTYPTGVAAMQFQCPLQTPRGGGGVPPIKKKILST